MKTTLQIVFVSAAGIVGVFLGMALRQPVQPQIQPSAAVVSDRPDMDSASSPAGGFFSSPGTAVRLNPRPLVSQLEHDLSLSTGVKRWLRWWEALDQATADDMPALVRLAQGKADVLRLIGARWAQIDPKHMFESLMANGSPSDTNHRDLIRQLLKDWTPLDPEAVIATLNESSGTANGGPWAWTVAGIVMKSDPERGLKLFSEWNIVNYGPSMNKVRSWAKANPRHAAEFTLKHRAGYATESAMKSIGKEWGQIDPAAALQFAAQHGDKFTDAMGEAVVREWAYRDLQSAGEWLATTDPRMRQQFAETFVEVWAKQDATGALEWSQKNLTGSAQHRAVKGVLKGAAGKDVSIAAQMVAEMTPSSARAAAAAGVAEKWIPQDTSSKPEGVKPEFVSWLGSLDTDSVKRVLGAQSYKWLAADPNSLAQFIAQADATSVPDNTYSRVARRMTTQDPRGAMEWVQALPDQHSLSTGKEAYGQWQLHQPDAARQWLNELPGQDSRRTAYAEGALEALIHLPQAVEHFAALPPTEKSMARKIVNRQRIESSHKERLLTALTGGTPVP
jgi:hypothetical protein